MEINKARIILYLIAFINIILFYNYLYNSKTNILTNDNQILKQLSEEEGEVLHLIKYNFTTKHNIRESEDPITYLILNDIVIPITLGTPNQTILASLRFNDYPFFLSSPLIKLENNENQSNIFIKDNSSSYRFIRNEKLFYKSQLQEAERANETFYFNNYNIIAYNFSFFYASKMSYDQSGGVVGLCLEDSNQNLHSGMNFFTQLKYKKIISYKTFFIDFNKNNEEGEFIIGAYPHEYSKEKYKYDNYHDIRGYAETTFVTYGFVFDEINIGNNKIKLNITKISEGNKRAMTAELKIEFGFILAPSDLEENITKTFIDLYKCNAYITNFQEIYGNRLFSGQNYKYYVCENSYSSNSKLSFFSREMEYTFVLDKNDLFMTYNNKTYFNIIFPNIGYRTSSWIFGKPLFLKYKWVFDPDKKRLGFYEENKKNEIDNEDIKRYNEKNTILIFIILIITVIVFLIVFSIFIYEFFIKKLRKIRKNEVDEDYEYKNEKDDEQNNLNINSS